MKQKPLIKFTLAAIAATLVVAVNATPAKAYSYGEKQDPMVTLFKSALVAAKGGKWGELSKLAKKGIKMQDGHKFDAKALAPRFETAIAAKSVGKTAETFANLVYLSVREKLHDDLKDYNSTKSRLKLARKSYMDVLDGNVKKKDAARSAKIQKHFDSALDSIGNPGLAGAAKKPVDQKAYDSSVKEIEALIKKSFPGFNS